MADYSSLYQSERPQTSLGGDITVYKSFDRSCVPIEEQPIVKDGYASKHLNRKSLIAQSKEKSARIAEKKEKN